MTKKLEVFIREEALDAVKDALQKIGIIGMNVFEVRGHGRQGGIELPGERRDVGPRREHGDVHRLVARPLAGGADDEAEPFRRVELEHDVAHAVAHVFVLDLARDADAPQRRHQDQIAAGNADVPVPHLEMTLRRGTHASSTRAVKRSSPHTAPSNCPA